MAGNTRSMSHTDDQLLHERVCTAATESLKELGYDPSLLADQTLKTIETTLDNVVANHQELFQSADKAADGLAVFEALACGEFSRGPRPNVKLWEDVTLATLLALHDEQAARLFCERYAQQVSGWEFRFSHGTPFSVEEFLADLLLPRKRAGPRITGYAGLGPFDGWLKQVYRSICDKRRKKQAGPGGEPFLSIESSPENQHRATSMKSDEDAPDERYARNECAELLAPVIRDCIGVLDDFHRQVLFMSVVDGVQQTKIAQLYGVEGYDITRMKQRAIKHVSDAFFEIASRSSQAADESLRLCIDLLLERFPVT